MKVGDRIASGHHLFPEQQRCYQASSATLKICLSSLDCIQHVTTVHLSWRKPLKESHTQTDFIAFGKEWIAEERKPTVTLKEGS